jgi:lipoprotein-releasing system ATP-binding protein
LDTKNKEELHQLFFDLRDKFGQTFVIVTHDEGLAKLTDRTIHLKDGQIIATDTATTVTRDGSENIFSGKITDETI